MKTDAALADGHASIDRESPVAGGDEVAVHRHRLLDCFDAQLMVVEI